jgi:hypothetical protein
MRNLLGKAMPFFMIATFLIGILINLFSNWEDNDYRSQADYRETIEYINQKAIPGTILYTSAMEYAAFDAYSLLAKIRRDFIFQRHKYELDGAFFKPGIVRIDVPAFFYHRDTESKEPLYYMKDFNSIRQDFFVAPLEKTPIPKFRHIVADSGNAREYQARAIRNIYYLLPKQLENHLSKPHLDLRDGNLEANKFYFISNAEYDGAGKSLHMLEMSYPLNVFVPARKETSGKVGLELLFANKPDKSGCKFKSAQLQFFYNNRFIKESELSFGSHREELLLPKQFNHDQVNVLSFVLSFNQGNQFSRETVSPNMCQLAIREYSYSAVPDFT